MLLIASVSAACTPTINVFRLMCDRSLLLAILPRSSGLPRPSVRPRPPPCQNGRTPAEQDERQGSVGLRRRRRPPGGRGEARQPHLQQPQAQHPQEETGKGHCRRGEGGGGHALHAGGRHGPSHAPAGVQDDQRRRAARGTVVKTARIFVVVVTSIFQTRLNTLNTEYEIQYKIAYFPLDFDCFRPVLERLNIILREVFVPSRPVHKSRRTAAFGYALCLFYMRAFRVALSGLRVYAWHGINPAWPVCSGLGV